MKRILLTLSIAGLLAVAPAFAQDMEDVEIGVERVADGIHMLTGRGGNIGLIHGDDGAFMIDDQYAPLTDRIRAAVAKVHDGDIRFVFNTHWHGDHTGGNENMAESGSLIVAHDNVRRRLAAGQFMEAFDREVPPAPEAALPVVTFSDEVTFHINDQTVHAFHVARAHTDGDAVVHFREANVIHTGDIVFNGFYPFIDTGSGGSIDGMIDGVERILDLADDDTRIIPGHGPLADRDRLEEYLEMLSTVRDRVAAAIERGRSLEEIVAGKPTAEYDEEWGDGFIPPDRWVGMIHGSLSSDHGDDDSGHGH